MVVAAPNSEYEHSVMLATLAHNITFWCPALMGQLREGNKAHIHFSPIPMQHTGMFPSFLQSSQACMLITVDYPIIFYFLVYKFPLQHVEYHLLFTIL
jgi:hypothetical protein